MRGGGPHRAVQQYAVNGALHYGLAVLDEGTYSEVIIIGINGWELKDGRLINPELKAYYVAQKNGKVPKEIPSFEFSQMKSENIDSLYHMLDKLLLTDKELERLKRDKEELLEQSIKNIHQRIYDDVAIKNLLSTNDKLFFLRFDYVRAHDRRCKTA